MDQDLKRLLEENNQLLRENLKLAEENNALTTKVHSYVRNSMIMRVVYWGLVIILAIGAYFVSLPYIKSLTGFYEDFGGNVNQASQSLQDPNLYLGEGGVFETFMSLLKE